MQIAFNPNAEPPAPDNGSKMSKYCECGKGKRPGAPTCFKCKGEKISADSKDMRAVAEEMNYKAFMEGELLRMTKRAFKDIDEQVKRIDDIEIKRAKLNATLPKVLAALPRILATPLSINPFNVTAMQLEAANQLRQQAEARQAQQAADQLRAAQQAAANQQAADRLAAVQQAAANQQVAAQQAASNQQATQQAEAAHLKYLQDFEKHNLAKLEEIKQGQEELKRERESIERMRTPGAHVTSMTDLQRTEMRHQIINAAKARGADPGTSDRHAANQFADQIMDG